MKPKLSLLYLFFVFVCTANAQYTENDIYAYIETYQGIAMEKMKTDGIPASITLAQGILESAAGTSDLAVKANNHFGIKCHANWTGETYFKSDDSENECFRKYDKVEESFSDHSAFLKAKRYETLFALEKTDYHGWALGLKNCGYATNPKYPERLVRIIETYNLAHFDTIVAFGNDLAHLDETLNQNPPQDYPEEIGDKPDPQQKESFLPPINHKGKKKPHPQVYDPATATSHTPTGEEVSYPYTKRTVYYNNGSYFILAKKGDTYFDIAMDVQQPLSSIKKYNDVPTSRYEPMEGERVYIEKKKKYSDLYYRHIVTAPREDLRYICQKYGCRMSSIMTINQLENNTILVKGEIVLLQRVKK